MSATDVAPGPVRLEHLPSFLLTRAARHVHRIVFDRFDEADSHGYHYRVLAALDEYGPTSQVELARRCVLDRSDIVVAVDALAERRFVERATDPRDRRRNIITLTRRGRARLIELDGLITAAQDEAFAALDAEELTQLSAMLTRIVDHHTGRPGPA